MSLCVVQRSPTVAEKVCEHFTINEIYDLIDTKFFTDDEDMEAEWQRFFDG